MMNTLQRKIEKLQEQQNKISEEMRVLLKKRNEELSNVLNHLPSTHLDPLVLVGGLLYVIEEAAKNPLKKEQWHQAGGKFQRRCAVSKSHQPFSNSGTENANL